MPLGVLDYARLHASCLDTQLFQLMRFLGERDWIYDNRYGVELLSAVGAWVKRWMHWGGQGAVARCDKAAYVYILFIRCTEEQLFASNVVSIVGGSLTVTDDAPVTYDLDYVAFTRHYNTLHFVTSFDHWLKEIVCDQRFCVRSESRLLVNCHCAYSFGIPTRQREKLFVQVPSGCKATKGITCCLHPP